MSGAEFLNAGSVVSTDGVDGLHLTFESEKKLRAAVAAKVKEIYRVQQIDLRAPYQISSTL